MKLPVKLGLILTFAVALFWFTRSQPTAPRATAAPSTAHTAAPAAPTAPLATASTSPTPTLPPPPDSASRPRLLVFGENGPVTLADIPAGRFRDEVLALSDAARARALTALAALRIPVSNVASLHTDVEGALYFACAKSPSDSLEEADLLHAATTPTISAASDGFAVSVPVALPPVRHSKPGAARVIYLDFNGHVVTGTSWNSDSGAPSAYNCTAYDTDNNAGSFSPTEQAAIVLIWERVAESFRAFDVDVTTEQPTTFNNQTARVVITKPRDANGVSNPSSATASGVAYLNVFGNTNFATATSVCFVYQDSQTPASIAAIASHELGHQMGLSHDGTSTNEYYAGHGTGEISWAPIMGSSNRNVLHWSKGEYYDANNSQDDLTIITAKLTGRTGDIAGTDGAATALVANGATLQQRGLLETTGDTDTYTFTTSGGAFALTVSPVFTTALANRNSLDVAAELRDAAGTLITRADPTDTPIATFAQTLSAGTYFIRITGAGTGTPLANPPSGYTAYGSIGTYEIAGTVAPTTNLIAAAIAQDPENQTQFPGNAVSFSVVARGNPATTYAWQRSINSGGTWSTLTDSSPYTGSATSTLTISDLATAMSGERFRCIVSNSAGSATSAAATLTISTPPPATLPAFDSFPIISSFGRGIPAGTSQNLTVTLTSGSDPLTLRWQRNGVDIPGADGPVYYLRNWQPADTGSYRVVATNAAGTVTSPAFNQFVAPEGGWQWRHPLPTGNALTRAAYINGRFFIGGVRGTVLTSTDGANWSVRTLPAANNVYSFHFLNDLYVALASLGAIFTSPDGVTWTSRNSGVFVRDTGSGLQDMAHGDGRLVAVGLGGITSTSTDGVTWTPGTAGTTEDLTGVAFAFGRFHAVSSVSGRIFSSANGVTWTSLITPTSGMRRIAFGAGRLVAVGIASDTLVSTNGTTWTSGPPPTSEALLGINFINGLFYAVGTGGVILTSPDGVTWTARSSSGNRSYLQNVAFGNGLYVIPGQSGTSGRALLVSSDGATWRETIASVSGVGTSLRGVTTGAETLVAVGGGGTVLQSTDGAQWSPRSSATTVQLNDVHFGSGRFVAVGVAGTIITSTDGSSWSAQTAPTNVTLNGVRFDNGLWVIAAASGRIFTSPNGTTWTQRYNGGSATFNKVAYGNGRFVAIGAAGALVTSTDGVNWTASAALTSEAINDITYAAGLFVAVGTGGFVRTSPNGVTWTDRSFSNDALTSVNYLAGQFLATGPGSTYYVSADASTWTARFTGTSDAMLDAAALSNELFLVGDNSSILSAGAPLLTALTPQTAVVGAPVILGTTVSASAFPLTYQWTKNGVALPGASGPTLSFSAVTATDAGSYVLTVTGPTGTVTTPAALLTVNVPPSGLTSRLSNLSVLTLLAPNQVLTVGFTMSGGSKPVLLRAAGPGLRALGVSSAMADPKLALFDGSTQVAANDNWGYPSANIADVTAANVAQGAFAFPSSISLDAALVTSITGGRSVQVSGPTAGTVIVEAYDAGTGNTPRLVNLSALNAVSPSNILIAGFTINGTGTKTVLIRAIGPGLTALGVGGALADPKLELYNSAQVKIAENDTYASSLASTFTAVGAFALTAGSKDAALLVTLAAGGYTVQVSGVAATSGAALVEVYEVP